MCGYIFPEWFVFQIVLFMHRRTVVTFNTWITYRRIQLYESLIVWNAWMVGYPSRAMRRCARPCASTHCQPIPHFQPIPHHWCVPYHHQFIIDIPIQFRHAFCFLFWIPSKNKITLRMCNLFLTVKVYQIKQNCQNCPANIKTKCFLIPERQIGQNLLCESEV